MPEEDAEQAYPPRYSPAPPLKSTQSSKEAEFDADRDSLDEILEDAPSIPTENEREANLEEEEEEESGPLLEGLLEQGMRRGSVDASISNEIPPWRRKGAGLLSGIASQSVSFKSLDFILCNSTKLRHV